MYRYAETAVDESSTTANTWRFCIRSCAAGRLESVLSSTAWRSILRPLTPPLAFWASTRALHAWSESAKFGAAGPVPDQMNPSVTDLSLTPDVSLDCGAGAPAATPRPSAITVPAHNAGTKRPCRNRNMSPPSTNPDPSEPPAGDT